jgi:hypothetical protein
MEEDMDLWLFLVEMFEPLERCLKCFLSNEQFFNLSELCVERWLVAAFSLLFVDGVLVAKAVVGVGYAWDGALACDFLNNCRILLHFSRAFFSLIATMWNLFNND